LSSRTSYVLKPCSSKHEGQHLTAADPALVSPFYLPARPALCSAQAPGRAPTHGLSSWSWPRLDQTWPAFSNRSLGRLRPNINVASVQCREIARGFCISSQPCDPPLYDLVPRGLLGSKGLWTFLRERLVDFLSRNFRMERSSCPR